MDRADSIPQITRYLVADPEGNAHKEIPPTDTLQEAINAAGSPKMGNLVCTVVAEEYVLDSRMIVWPNEAADSVPTPVAETAEGDADPPPAA